MSFLPVPGYQTYKKNCRSSREGGEGDAEDPSSGEKKEYELDNDAFECDNYVNTGVKGKVTPL